MDGQQRTPAAISSASATARRYTASFSNDPTSLIGGELPDLATSD
jgi:hypothetical protein